MNGLHFLAEIDLSQVMDTSRPIGERLLKGLQTMGLGMGIIFGVLILIWLACELLHYFLHRADTTEQTDLPQEQPVVEVAPPQPVTDDGALIAAITAAIAAMLEQPTSAFRVVSFRRTTEHGRPWNSGRTE